MRTIAVQPKLFVQLAAQLTPPDLWFELEHFHELLNLPLQQSGEPLIKYLEGDKDNAYRALLGPSGDGVFEMLTFAQVFQGRKEVIQKQQLAASSALPVRNALLEQSMAHSPKRFLELLTGDMSWGKLTRVESAPPAPEQKNDSSQLQEAPESEYQKLLKSEEQSIAFLEKQSLRTDTDVESENDMELIDSKRQLQ